MKISEIIYADKNRTGFWRFLVGGGAETAGVGDLLSRRAACANARAGGNRRRLRAVVESLDRDHQAGGFQVYAIQGA